MNRQRDIQHLSGSAPSRLGLFLKRIALCLLVHALDAEARGCASTNIGTIRASLGS
jgi:hypothetical protein